MLLLTQATEKFYKFHKFHFIKNLKIVMQFWLSHPKENHYFLAVKKAGRNVNSLKTLKKQQVWTKLNRNFSDEYKYWWGREERKGKEKLFTIPAASWLIESIILAPPPFHRRRQKVSIQAYRISLIFLLVFVPEHIFLLLLQICSI